MADIFACDNEVRAAFVDAAQHDMAVRVASVEVVDCDPVEPCLEVLFNLLHQSAQAHEGGGGGKIGDLFDRVIDSVTSQLP